MKMMELMTFEAANQATLYYDNRVLDKDALNLGQYGVPNGATVYFKIDKDVDAEFGDADYPMGDHGPERGFQQSALHGNI